MSDKTSADVKKYRADNALLKRTVELCMSARQELIERLEARDAEIDRLTESCKQKDAALQMAVDWIEDDRWDDDYITEDWYHAAIAELSQGEK